ncbi:hypothetical protein EIN_205430 [Entamoeba invadens IP1]|uniref:Uncharacterized protein n=1 Tax=Entamoeba invadens IP1 TaxID=370355 RepID=A0A0A1U9F5_ENTIV|nr:hypothetical protein EIN_205430 [Entamoeba invadens IP1]ELP91616.1 hypothetical protein EIN_205430 [Entamoeba invadens IP1]|eukprot:XP_004258387.1 hypothetical protein EIN_205430 [Entamoeba invadens IP1]
MSEQTLSFKVCIIGNEKVGKTSLVKRLLFDTYSEPVEAFEDIAVSKKVTYMGKEVTLIFYDPLDNGMSTTASFYNEAHLLVAVFSLNTKDSLENCKYWLSYGERYITRKYLKVLVGLEADCTDRLYKKEDGEAQGNAMMCKYFEVSAKTGDGAKEFMDGILNMLFVENHLIGTQSEKPKKDGKKGKCLLL